MNLNIKSINWPDDLAASQHRRGFTLVELLLALVITGIVISLAGSGLYALMTADRRAQIETTDRLELEQALAFMTDEIKMSKQVLTSLPEVDGKAHFNDASGSSRVKPILILSPSANSGLTHPIVYYIADPPNSSVWIGPRVIYRWGPTLLQNGNYSDGNGKDLTTQPPGTPVNYYNEVLIDRISDRAATTANIACEPGYSNAMPGVTERAGFYACISADNKSVKLWMYKQSNPSFKSQSIDALVVTRSN
ncbi:prepilin-type N-terminal cleavage/methylation domain-containing protein [Chamaesiphon sp. VAR_69_metabat_338]|uniref:PulJ/GspJ family protein n=1 Tax=Chamaesiphon sp. VAR_69_metabat_338 TaxID=2964704 RepID=UPI00286DC132|nr:prepilin-type N-terminal cleavage/methylation domain-containing protein [Chamaesiphon sp. VAR_69_metabat_338]